jgi:hypothetical protein
VKIETVTGKFLRHERTSGLVPPLDYQHFCTGLLQVSRRRQSIMAGTDDDDVILQKFGHLSLPQGGA